MKKYMMIVWLMLGLSLYGNAVSNEDIMLYVEESRLGSLTSPQTSDDIHIFVTEASKSEKLFKKACDDGSGARCNTLGYVYHAGFKDIKQDDFKAVKLFRKACDGGVNKGCLNLGYMFLEGKGVRQNNATAVKIYRKACDSGSVRGCSIMSVFYELGTRGVRQNIVKAKELYGMACDDGEALGCKNYARLNRQ